jgi:DNA-binding PadR family transcriptional regulator
MSLRHAVLAALLEGEASGYDLAKQFDASTANYWMATPQQLYRELESMTSDGLLHATVVQQERRPNKRVFGLTAAGRDALVEFTVREPKPTAVRDELMIKVAAADSGDTAAVAAHIAERLQWSTGKLARYNGLRAKMLDGRTEAGFLAEAERIGPYLTLMRGISFEEENIRWAERALSVLDERARTDTERGVSASRHARSRKDG